MKDLLVFRLNQIADTLSQMPGALALLGLGSTGKDAERMDEYSDLDFFVVCKKGTKRVFLEDIKWLRQVCPVSFAYKNTKDGYKVMFEDGVFCEYGIFEPDDLESIPFDTPKILWQAPEFDASVAEPRLLPKVSEDADWLLDEVLSNLYVGMCRYKRGEKISAYKFIQSYALEGVLKLIEKIEVPQNVKRDTFSVHRRFEGRYPGNSPVLSKLLQGYDYIPESALAFLEFLESHFTLNETMKNKILDLCNR